MDELKFYVCKKCGNIVVTVQGDSRTLSCCGDPMVELVAGSTDAAQEKHVPDVKVEGGRVNVTVGSVEHPMTDEHYIQWIALSSGHRMEIHKLFPGQAPETTFEGAESGIVYAYCNLHGLWSKKFGKEEFKADISGCSPEFGGCKI
ncbi:MULTISPECIES: desulfoferrodoxin family protein [Megasphaera]|uniref:Desulfoferrodoxin n=1 Tax=Megasphaera vaginalis (ex Srinivasan et al. 2021) TaxID=1111454 RepID=U7UL42_9FIRM|nr:MULTISPECIES: desulfoferrodoxin family protein [Megasphaera]ERT60026.1 putative superoxide reductase [Megasphaera vaginalis (ex Srinivasan et al. 2021)]